MSTPGLLPQIPRDRLMIPLDEVAELTGWSKRSLLEDCRAGVIDHIYRRGTYSFTPEQLDALVRRYMVQGGGEPKSAHDAAADDAEAVRLANVERLTRRGRAGRRRVA